MVTFIQKIKCPIHFVLIAGKEPYLTEPNPAMRNIKDADAKAFGVKKMRRKKDRWGRFILDERSFIQPEFEASYFLKHVYDSKRLQCQACRRCIAKV